MMAQQTYVSVVMPFLNAESFLVEAVESVRDQSYPFWELLLVDDGSTDESTRLAREFAMKDQQRIQYLEHPCHANRGMSASRNIGIEHASGDVITFLDSDDIWLPFALEKQLERLEQFPAVGMLYGATRYWYSWTGTASDFACDRLDFQPRSAIDTQRVIAAPGLVAQFLNEPGSVPCMCSIMVRRDVVTAVGGFVAAFRGLYEDQAFYAKVALEHAVLVVDDYWALYRQHPGSSCAIAARDGTERQARQFYLDWLESYLHARHIRHPLIWLALRRQQYFLSHPIAFHLTRRAARVCRSLRALATNAGIPDSLTSAVRRWMPGDR